MVTGREEPDGGDGVVWCEHVIVVGYDYAFGSVPVLQWCQDGFQRQPPPGVCLGFGVNPDEGQRVHGVALSGVSYVSASATATRAVSSPHAYRWWRLPVGRRACSAWTWTI